MVEMDARRAPMEPPFSLLFAANPVALWLALSFYP